MASRIKGITVEIGGDVSGLDKALSGVNKNIKDTQSELKDVEKLLKLDPTNTELLRQKQELLAKSVVETGEKLETLKKANEQAAESVKKYDAWKAAYDPIQSEIEDTKKKLADLKVAQKEALEIEGADGEEYKRLQNEISDTSKQLKELKQQAEEVSTEFGNPISHSQYNALQREIIATESEFNGLRTQAEKTENSIKGIDDKALRDVADAADDAEKELKEAGSEASNFGDYLKAGAIVEGAKGIVSSLKDVSEESKEYMKIMGSLEVSSAQAGYSAEQTAAVYKKLYGVLADEQTSATTVANLQALNLSQEELISLTDLAIGAWSKYGDSIPIDGLAEAINETVRTGQVTGVLADVLNWGTKEGEDFGLTLKQNIQFTELSSKELEKLTDREKADYEAKKAQYEAIEAYNASISEAVNAEDKFNLVLADAGSEAERVNLIMNTLSNQGLASASEAWKKNNEALVESNEANADMQEQLAQLGETLLPVFTQLTEVAAGLLEGFNELDEGTQKFILGSVALVAVLGPILSSIGSITLGVSGLSSSVGLLSKVHLPSLGSAFSTVVKFIVANPIVALIAAIVALVALIATKGDEIQGVLQKVDDFLQGVFATDWTNIFGPVLGESMNAFFRIVKEVWDAIYLIFTGVIDFIRGVFTGDWKRAWNGVVSIFEGIFNGLVTIAKIPINGVISLLNTAVNAINLLIEGLNGLGLDMPEWMGGGSWKPNIPKIPNIPYLAKGGILTQGSAVVGEAGPEILTMSGGNAVVQPLTGSATAGKGLEELTALAAMYLPYLAETRGVYLDSGVMVGELAPQINEELEKIDIRERNR